MLELPDPERQSENHKAIASPMSELLTILHGDALEKLRELPDESVHCCVTSPPYWGLRDYGTGQWEGGNVECDHKFTVSSPYNANFNERWGNASGARKQESERHEVSYKSNCGKCGAKRIDAQLGLEKTPEEYVAKMVEVFREVRRVLRRDGTLWLNLGDSYVGANNTDNGGNANFGSAAGVSVASQGSKAFWKGLPSKNLVGIPWRVAFALQADGWWLRSDIIWAKPNPMPESVTDRPTKAHEYLFLLSKSANYFYDAEAVKEPAINAGRMVGYDGSQKNCETIGDPRFATRITSDRTVGDGRNKRSVWTIATQPYPEAHFATFPEELPKLCIMAGTSAKGCCAKCGAPWERIVEPTAEYAKMLGRVSPHKGNLDGYGRSNKGIASTEQVGLCASYETLGWQPTYKCCSWHEPKDRVYCVNHSEGFFDYKTEPCTVLDPFAGSGTVGKVALELGRKAVLIELNPKYVKLIDQRCDVTPGLQLC